MSNSATRLKESAQSTISITTDYTKKQPSRIYNYGLFSGHKKFQNISDFPTESNPSNVIHVWQRGRVNLIPQNGYCFMSQTFS